MPELPEVEALVSFLTEHCVGQVVARVDVASINVLKTFAPPVTALQGLEVTGAARHGKFLDLDVSGVHLITHLSRAGWLHWRDKLPPALLNSALVTYLSLERDELLLALIEGGAGKPGGWCALTTRRIYCVRFVDFKIDNARIGRLPANKVTASDLEAFLEQMKEDGLC